MPASNRLHRTGTLLARAAQARVDKQFDPRQRIMALDVAQESIHHVCDKGDLMVSLAPRSLAPALQAEVQSWISLGPAFAVIGLAKAEAAFRARVLFGAPMRVNEAFVVDPEMRTPIPSRVPRSLDLQPGVLVAHLTNLHTGQEDPGWTTMGLAIDRSSLVNSQAHLRAAVLFGYPVRVHDVRLVQGSTFLLARHALLRPHSALSRYSQGTLCAEVEPGPGLAPEWRELGALDDYRGFEARIAALRAERTADFDLTLAYAGEARNVPPYLRPPTFIRKASPGDLVALMVPPGKDPVQSRATRSQWQNLGPLVDFRPQRNPYA